MAPLVVALLLLLPISSSSATPRPHTPLPTGISIPPPQIHQACAATRFPDLCESTLSQSPSLPDNPSASDLILSAISSSSAAIPTALSHAASILASSASNPNRTNAARNCLDILSYSSHRLSKSSLAFPSSVPDSRAWTSAALIYQYGCFSAYKYVNGTKQVDDAMRYLLSLTSLTSNALSLLFSFHRFGNDTALWRPPQTERDGYWDSSSSPSPSSPVSIPSDLTPDATVCKDQGYCYKTVQEAVDAAPCFGSKRFVIQIKAGVYEEIVRVPFNKTNIVFLGDGMGKTVITGSLNAQMPGLSTYNTATVAVDGDGFMARDLTFENTTGPDSHQAVAFRSDSDLSVFENVEFLGHQDTLYCHSLRQYYRSCRIEGTVDFVFGNSATVFQNCTILVRPRQLEPEKGETNAVSAQGRTDPAQPTGFVFDNCTVDGTEEYLALYKANPAAHKNYLGRPWKEYSRTVFLNCKLGEIVRPEGWLPWTEDFALATLFYGEFGSYGPGGNVSARVSWSNQIPTEHVGVYLVENFIQGDGWVPT